jgi:RNA polymerase primary sigma factor
MIKPLEAKFSEENADHNQFDDNYLPNSEPLSKQKEKELFYSLEYSRNSKDIIKIRHLENEIASHNFRLVRKIIYKDFRTYLSENPDYLELESAGMMGLTNAIKKFNVERGYKFSTYAWRAIARSIQNHIDKNKRRPLPKPYEESLDKGKPDNRAEVDDLNYRNIKLLNQELRKLSPKERTVLEARYLNFDTQNLLQIGERLGLTKERIRQIQISSIGKLKKRLTGRVDF